MPPQLTKSMDSTTAPPSDVVEINYPDKDPDTIDNWLYAGIDRTRLPGCQLPFRALKGTPSWIWEIGYRVQERVGRRGRSGFARPVINVLNSLSMTLSSLQVVLLSTLLELIFQVIRWIRMEWLPLWTRSEKKRSLRNYSSILHSPSCSKSTYHRGGIRRRILKWIVTENHPLRIVETATFRDLIAAANPDAVDDIWPDLGQSSVYSWSYYIWM